MKKVNDAGAKPKELIRAAVFAGTLKVHDSLRLEGRKIIWRGKELEQLTDDEAALLAKRLGL
jgi:hypothetical protein